MPLHPNPAGLSSARLLLASRAGFGCRCSIAGGFTFGVGRFGKVVCVDEGTGDDVV